MKILRAKLCFVFIVFLLKTSSAELVDYSGDGPDADPQESGWGSADFEDSEGSEFRPDPHSQVTAPAEDRGSGSDFDIDDEESAAKDRSYPSSDIDLDEGSAVFSESGPCLEKKAQYLNLGKRFHLRCDEKGDFEQLQECVKDKCRCVDTKTGRKTSQRFDVLLRRCVDSTESGYDHTVDDIDKRGDSKQKKGQSLLTSNPGLVAGIIGGAVVGLLILILLVMFVVYRMRKKDEGSYALEKQKKQAPPPTHPYQPCPQEYYA